MIVFDLECSNGHIFEGWFDSLESFEKQNSEELVSCPHCNDTHVRKVMSPVAVKRSHSVDQAPSGPIDYQRLALLTRRRQGPSITRDLQRRS